MKKDRNAFQNGSQAQVKNEDKVLVRNVQRGREMRGRAHERCIVEGFHALEKCLHWPDCSAMRGGSREAVP